MQEEKKKSILKHPPAPLREQESRDKISSYIARQFFRFLWGVTGDGLGGEVAWLKILTIGRTKGVYPVTRRTIWEQSRGRLGAKSFRF
jgi:hypothetical protein